MSILRYMFDNEWKQRDDIEALKAVQASRRRQARRESRSAENRIDDLEAEVGELALLCRTLLTVLRETAVVDPDVLAETLKRVDLEDGVLDGRVTPEGKRPAAFREPKETPEAPTPRRGRRKR